MATFRVTVTPPDGGINKGQKVLPSQMRAALVASVGIIQPKIQEETPVGATGQLRNSYSHELDGSPLSLKQAAKIVNPALHHDFVDQGRAPGRRPPVSALIPWVGTKLGVPVEERRQVAYLVARKIGAEGTEGADMVRQGWFKARPRVKKVLESVGAKVGKAIASE